MTTSRPDWMYGPNGALTNQQPPNVIARFGTLLGAVVNVQPDTNPEFAHWECAGCTRKAAHRDYVDAALAAANEHAATCRALPTPGPAQ